MARQRVAGSTSHVPEERRLEYEVGTQHAQEPVRGMLIMNSQLGHHRIHRDGAGVVGHHEGSSLIRNRLDSRNLYSEPVAIQRTNSLQQHLVCEFRVETKIVDRILAGEALPKHAPHAWRTVRIHR